MTWAEAAGGEVWLFGAPAPWDGVNEPYQPCVLSRPSSQVDCTVKQLGGNFARAWRQGLGKAPSGLEGENSLAHSLYNLHYRVQNEVSDSVFSWRVSFQIICSQPWLHFGISWGVFQALLPGARIPEMLI